MMFEETDFEIPLEKQLRLRIINEEIDACTDIEALRENLKQCVKSLQTYQHLLNETLKKQLQHNRNQLQDKILKEINIIIDGNKSSS